MGLHDGVGDREDRDEAEHADPRAEAHADQARLNWKKTIIFLHSLIALILFVAVNICLI